MVLRCWRLRAGNVPRLGTVRRGGGLMATDVGGEGVSCPSGHAVPG